MNEMQKRISKKVQQYGAEHGIVTDLSFLVMKLYEEVGEFTNALLIHEGKARKRKLVSKGESKKMLIGEIADVIGASIAIADKLGINVENALIKTWFLNDNKDRKA